MTEEIGPLCCCEYFDVNNERNHILACCCNCVDFDEGFDSLISGTGLPRNNLCRFMDTFQDRCRIPWRGGAKPVAFDAVLPILILPFILLLASVSLWWTIFAFTTVTVFLLYIFRFFIQAIPRTKFFFVWTLSSIVLLYSVFEFIVIPLLEILLEENIALSVLIGIFLLCLYLLKLRASKLHIFEEIKDGKRVVIQPGTRFHNCSICQTTVPDKDHHCVWFDCCIGRQNQGLFMMALFFATASLLYSSNLTLTSVCHPFVFYKTILLPDDCSDVYQEYELGVCFVAALYSIMLAILLFIILLQQIVLVSVGLTSKEWSKLPISSKLLCGITAQKSHNRNFFDNWSRIVCLAGRGRGYSIISQT